MKYSNHRWPFRIEDFLMVSMLAGSIAVTVGHVVYEDSTQPLASADSFITSMESRHSDDIAKRCDDTVRFAEGRPSC